MRVATTTTQARDAADDEETMEFGVTRETRESSNAMAGTTGVLPDRGFPCALNFVSFPFLP